MELPLMQYANHAEAGRFLRDRGIAQVEGNNFNWVSRARSIALMLAAKQGEVTIDDVYPYIGAPDNPNSAGPVFRDRRFKFTGRRMPSTRAERHAGEVRVWELA